MLCSVVFKYDKYEFLNHRNIFQPMYLLDLFWFVRFPSSPWQLLSQFPYSATFQSPNNKYLDHTDIFLQKYLEAIPNGANRFPGFFVEFCCCLFQAQQTSNDPRIIFDSLKKLIQTFCHQSPRRLWSLVASSEHLKIIKRDSNCEIESRA